MKKFKIISVSFILFLGLGQLYAQDAKEYSSSSNYASNSTKKEKRVEKRSTRKELRKLEGNKVSNMSMKNFMKDFGAQTEAKWVRTSNYDVAAFVVKGHEIKAYYDADGELVGTTQYKTMDDLPDRGQKIIREKYKDYKVGQILFFNNNEANRSPMVLWGTEVMDHSDYFVELQKDTQKMILYVDPSGSVSLFKKL